MYIKPALNLDNFLRNSMLCITLPLQIQLEISFKKSFNIRLVITCRK